MAASLLFRRSSFIDNDVHVASMVVVLADKPSTKGKH